MHTIPTGLPEHTGLSWALGTSRNIFPDALMRQSPPTHLPRENMALKATGRLRSKMENPRFSPIFWSKQGLSLDLSAQSKCQQSLASIPIEVLDEAYWKSIRADCEGLKVTPEATSQLWWSWCHQELGLNLQLETEFWRHPKNLSSETPGNLSWAWTVNITGLEKLLRELDQILGECWLYVKRHDMTEYLSLRSQVLEVFATQNKTKTTK